jgi:hypothetical protein
MLQLRDIFPMLELMTSRPNQRGARYVLGSGASQLPFVEGCVVIQGPDIRQIKAWDPTIVHRHEACAPHLALAALEMYDHVLIDVVSAVQELILGTEGQEDFGSKDWNALVALELRVSDNNAEVDMF